jgi:energy-coupling factor transport system permease protein
MVLGALTDVEERTMALEARAFSAPGRRTSLRPVPDSGKERAVRWIVGLGAIGLVVLGILGASPLP